MAITNVKTTILTLLKEAENNLDQHLDKVNMLIDEAYLMSLDINDEESIARCMFLFGVSKYRKKDFTSANEFYNKSLEQCNLHHLEGLKSSVLKGLGDLRREVNDYEGALEYYLGCLEVDPNRSEVNSKKGKILYSIGIIYKELEQYQVALEYFKDAEDFCLKNKNNSKLLKLYNQIAACYLEDGKMKEAGEFALRSIRMAEELNQGVDLGYAYLVYAKFLYENSNIMNSRVHFEKSVKKFNELQNIPLLLEAMEEYGIMLFRSKKYKEAEDVLLETSIMLLSHKNYKVELKVNLYLAKIYEQLSEMSKAFTYFKRFYEVKSLNDEMLKGIKVKSIVNRYEPKRTDIKVKELTNINQNIVALSRLGREITSTLKLDELIEKITQSLYELISCDMIGIGVINQEKPVMDYYSIYKDHQNTVNIELKNKSFYLNDLLHKSEEVLDNDFIMTWSQKGGSFSFNGLEKSGSLMSCQLLFQKQVIGILTVQNHNKDAYKTNDLEMLKIFSSYTSIAIHNSLQSQAILDTNKKLKDLTEKDGLTKVFNRYALNTNINKIITRARKYENPFGIIMIDVDFFKEYNDNYGHLEGDQCLIKISQVLKDACEKEKSYIYRYGGDEFMIIILNKDAKGLELILNQIRKGITDLNLEHIFSRCADRVTLTIGAAVVNSLDNDYKKFFALADKALYIAKNRGRNNYKILTCE